MQRREARSKTVDKIEEAFARRDIGDVAHPHPIQRHAVDIELPGKAIRRDGIRVMRVGGGHATARSRSSRQPGLPHETRDALGARRQSRRAQFLMHARSAIRLPALRERDPHMGHQHVVDHRPPALRSPAIGVVAGHGHRQHAAHESHRELVLVTSDHGAPQRDSFAKYTATFLRRPAPGAASPPRGAVADSLGSSVSPDGAAPSPLASRWTRVHARS